MIVIESCLEFFNSFKMTRQIFLKLRKILEPAMVGAGKQHKICKFQFITLVCTRWSKMAKIPKISGTSEVKKSSFFKQKRLFCKIYTMFGTWFSSLQIVCLIRKCSKIRQDKHSIKFWEFPMSEQWELEKWTVICESWEGGSYHVIQTNYQPIILQESRSVSAAINKHIQVLKIVT